MKKIAFCFPGQGSLERGMGREIAEAVPEAMAVFERGSEACGLDLRQLCFDTPLDEIPADHNMWAFRQVGAFG